MLPGTPGEAARQMIDLVSHPVTSFTTGTSPARLAADGWEAAHEAHAIARLLHRGIRQADNQLLGDSVRSEPGAQ